MDGFSQSYKTDEKEKKKRKPKLNKIFDITKEKVKKVNKKTKHHKT